MEATATQDQTTETPEETDARQADRDLVAKWQDRIKAARKQMGPYLKEIKENRSYIKGEKVGTEDLEGEDSTPQLRRMNLIYSTLQAGLPHIYAKNPEVAITPSEAVTGEYRQQVKRFAKTCELVVNRAFSDGGLKGTGKAAVRSAEGARLGWVKVTYQKDIEQDPVILGRMNDTQENIRQLDALLCQCKDEEQRNQTESQKRELELMLEGLESESEVSVAEGFVYDNILGEDMVWDQDLRQLHGYATRAKYLGHRNFYHADEYEATFGKKPTEKARLYKANDLNYHNNLTAGSDESRTCVWEIWDSATNSILTFTEGEQDWTREPYQVNKVGERWYSLFALGLHPVDGQFMPMSSVSMLKRLQDEHEDIRDQEADFRKKNIPHFVTTADEKDIERKADAVLGEILHLVSENPNAKLSDIFDVSKTMTFDPNQYNTSQVRADVEFQSGYGDAARGSVAKTKTLGEAEILQQGMTDRTSEMRDGVEDFVLDMAIYTLETALQEMSQQQVALIAGPEAEWPDMGKAEVFQLVNIEVRAGSSGKPNKAQEQEQWLKLFLPELRNMALQVAELREKKQDQLAEVLVNLMRETIRRFDERIDVEEFLPQEEQQQGPNEQEMQAMQQEMDRLQAELDLVKGQAHEAHANAEQTEVETDLMIDNVIQQAAPRTLQ